MSEYDDRDAEEYERGMVDAEHNRCCVCGDEMPPGGLHKHWSGTYTCLDCWEGLAEDAADARRDDERMDR